jgi:hypothetical protein
LPHRVSCTPELGFPINCRAQDHLREVQAGLSRLEGKLADQGHQLTGIKKQIHSLEGQIHTLHGETLRYDERFDALEQRLDRIEKRLNFADALAIKCDNPRLLKCGRNNSTLQLLIRPGCSWLKRRSGRLDAGTGCARVLAILRACACGR